MRLDLGGIAQGYAADRCLENLARKRDSYRPWQMQEVILPWAMRPRAKRAGRLRFRSTIEAVDPKSPTSIQVAPSTTFRLANCGITTSGATCRYLEIGGKRYSHIIDPRSRLGFNPPRASNRTSPQRHQRRCLGHSHQRIGRVWLEKLKQKPKLKVWLNESKI